MDANAGAGNKIMMTAWATPADGISLDELIVELEASGHKILEIDREGNRLKLVDVMEKI